MSENDLSEELKGLSIALEDVCDRTWSRVEIMKDVTQKFKQGLLKLEQDDQWLLRGYESASSFVKGAELEYEENGFKAVAISEGLSETGAIILRPPQGDVREWHGNEIKKSENDNKPEQQIDPKRMREYILEG